MKYSRKKDLQTIFLLANMSVNIIDESLTSYLLVTGHVSLTNSLT
jgi:hypothetical protein